MGKKLTDAEARKLMIAAGLEPLVPYPGSRERWKCKCLKCGRIVRPFRGNIQQGQGGCGYCSGVKNDEEEATAVMRAADLEPLVPYPGAKKPWKCKCLTCGRIVTPEWTNIDQGQGGCAYCGGYAVDEEEVVEAVRAVYLEPLVPYSGSGEPWESKCLKCGRIVTPTWDNVKKNQSGTGCKYCTGQEVDIGEAIDIMRAADLEPLVPYSRSDEPWECKCLKCGRTVSPRYDDIKQDQGGCSNCADYGFNLTEPAIVYLIEHKEHRALKVGVTGIKSKKKRLSVHKNRGWEAIGTWVIGEGSQALEVEQKVLDYWFDDLGAHYFLRESDMPQGGWTETVDSLAVNVESTIALIEDHIKSLDQ